MAPLASSSATPEPAISSSEAPMHTAKKQPPQSGLKRKLHAFVEIPPSPLHTSRKKHDGSRASGKSTTKLPPLSSKHVNRPPIVELISSGPPARKKTKLSNVEVVIARDKPEKTIKIFQHKFSATPGNTSIATYGLDRSLFTCHQCKRQKGDHELARCARKTCVGRFCNICLRNRYGETIENVKQRGFPRDPQGVNGAPSDPYTWDCFKCRKVCNCSICRKSLGLEPLGKDVALRFSQPLDKSNSKPKNVRTKRVIEKSSKSDGAKPKASVPRKRRTVNSPQWIAVPEQFTYQEVEDRVFIREFFLRFEQLIELTHPRLDELDEFDSFSFTLAKALLWNILSLIASDVDDEPNKFFKSAITAIKQTQSTRRTPGSLWAPIATLRMSLASTSYPLSIPDPSPPSLRASSRSRSSSVVPAPTRTLPSRASKQNSVTSQDFYGKATPSEPDYDDIIDAEQFVPVLVALIEAALQLPSCKAEIENGANDLRDENKRYWAALREENDRWSEESKALTEEKNKEAKNAESGFDLDAWATKYKAAQTTHKQTVLSLENEHAIKSQAWQPRFTPLGKDTHGRTYFAGTTLIRSKGSYTIEDAKELKKWGWFLAVWGKAKTGLVNSNGHEDGQLQGEEEKWWGFYDPSEIRKLAKWIGATSEEDLVMNGTKDDTTFTSLSLHDDLYNLGEFDEWEYANEVRKAQVERRRLPNSKDIAELVKSLNNYANVLEFRFSKDNNKK